MILNRLSEQGSYCGCLIKYSCCNVYISTLGPVYPIFSLDAFQHSSTKEIISENQKRFEPFLWLA
ncbi:hypothetical protein BpHYR1_031156 [Brachionus plicatilis]|uniref:Uncharacterized protein n=1 Tax=Brachionus plicatilis TaxID=10195 RepID=A0A3M7PG08_BRAPC|nr:hypothetical protein BpHYR1_031156 [Brachionus plicatilis]